MQNPLNAEKSIFQFSTPACLQKKFHGRIVLTEPPVSLEDLRSSKRQSQRFFTFNHAPLGTFTPLFVLTMVFQTAAMEHTTLRARAYHTNTSI